MGVKESVSILGGVGWLAFLIIWLFFYAGDYNIYQNIAIFIASIVIVAVITSAPWAHWGMKHKKDYDLEMWVTKGFKLRVALSIIFGFLFLIFIIAWLFFFAIEFNAYQNIAIFIVSLLIMGGIMGAIWASWGIKHGHKFEKKHFDSEIEKKIEIEVQRRVKEELAKRKKKE